MAQQPPRQQVPRQGPRTPQPQMAPAMKILRIGVILGDKIVEERLVRGREPVTIGQSAKNTFAVPAPELPKSWMIFSLQGGRYVLNVSDAMDGRLSDGGQVLTLAQLKQTGRAQRSGAGWQIPLSENARGKIVVGDMTLLFQFVMAPPLQPRPQLPHSVRGSIADSIDPYLAVVLGLSLLFHGMGFVYFYWIMDPPKEVVIDEPPEQFARATIDKLPAISTEVGNTGEAEKVLDEAPPAEKGGGDDDAKKAKKPAAGGASSTASVDDKVKRTAVLRVLGGAGGGGKFLDVSGGKDIGGSLDKGLQRVGADGTGIAATGGGSLEAGVTGGDAGGGGIAEGKETGVSGPTGPKTTGGEKTEREVKGTGSTGDVEGEESGGLNPDVFERTIKGRPYQESLACYTRVLKLNPTIGGKVEISLTVGQAGNVIKISVNGFNADVDSCISAAARRGWRFPKPEEATSFDFSFIFRKAN